MTKLQTTALCAIALALIVDLMVEHVQPVIVQALREADFIAAARKCHEARSNRQQVAREAIGHDQRTNSALSQSAVVGLMDCYEMEVLRESMLAWGVSEHRLQQLSLHARKEAATSLQYFVEGVASQP